MEGITSLSEVVFNGDPNKVHPLGREMDDKYFAAIRGLCLNPEVIQRHKDLAIVYTPLHGTGITAVPQCLKLFGFENILLEPSQKVSDGNFPTVVYPNPEEPQALKLALKMAVERGAELVMSTDPDTDRVGIAVKEPLTGDFKLLNGNQTGALIIYYLLRTWRDKNKFKGNEFIVKTIVTTRLIENIAKHFKVPCDNVLTGFKYIAGIIREREGKRQFIAGGEESYGYLIGDFVRDKDAVGGLLHHC